MFELLIQWSRWRHYAGNRWRLNAGNSHQGLGIGKELVKRTQAIIGDEVSLILLSAPDAMSYYPTLGFELAGNAYVIRRKH